MKQETLDDVHQSADMYKTILSTNTPLLIYFTITFGESSSIQYNGFMLLEEHLCLL